MHDFLKRAAQGALVVLALNGCSTNRALLSHPTLEQRCDDKSFVDYTNDVNDICALRDSESMIGREQLFHRYIDWLCEISQTQFDKDDFNIIPDNEFLGFFHSGIAGLFTPGGMYWFDTIYIRSEATTFASIAHEFGHATDTLLDYSDYAFSKRSRVRAEAVSEAFELYTNIRLLEEGVTALKEQFELDKPVIVLGRSLEGHIDQDSRYTGGRILTYILMNDFAVMREVWHYLANTPEDDIYSRVESIIARERNLSECVNRGHERYTGEVTRATPASIRQ